MKLLMVFPLSSQLTYNVSNSHCGGVEHSITFTLWRRNTTNASALKFEIMIFMQNEVHLAFASSYCHEPAPHANPNTTQLILQTIDRNQGPRALFVHVLASPSPCYVPALMLACIAVRH